MDKTRYLSPRQYEMLTILLPDQGEDETKAAVEKMLSYITDEQGTVDSVAADSPWGRRRLAYTVRHEGVDYRDGFYVLVYFTAMPNAISEIERELKLDTNVVRYLLLTQDPHMGEQIDPSAISEAAEAAARADGTLPALAGGTTIETTTTSGSPVVAESTADSTIDSPVAGDSDAMADPAAVEAEAISASPADGPAETPSDPAAAVEADEAIADAPIVEDEVAAEGEVAEAAPEDVVVEAPVIEDETAAEGDVEPATEV